LHGFFGQPVAETVLAGIMALKRGINKTVKLQERGEWQGAALRRELTLLYKSKVIILGSGSIGSALKKMLRAFDAEVFLYGRNPERAELTTPEELDRTLSRADIVVGCLPENTGTRHFFNKDRLALLSPNAIFVNVGRGSFVDEAALLEMLQQNRLVGAVLDVTVQEPLPLEHPFWRLPNLLLTQHCGGGTNDELLKKVEFFFDNLRCFQSGEPLLGIVRKS
jgi:phosphoglycerate dehydrogenase-like enzyme